MVPLGKRSISAKISIVIVIFLLLTLTSPLFISEAESDNENSSWPKFRRDLENTGRNEDATSEISNHTGWKYETDDAIDASPAIGPDGTVYIGGLDGNLSAIRPDGSERWKFETNSSISSTPALADDGSIYFVTTDGGFYSLNEDGTKNWVLEDLLEPKNVTQPVISSPVIREDGTILVASEQLYSVYPNGTVEWVFTHEFEDGPTDGFIHSTPALDDDGNIYFGYTLMYLGISPGMLVSLDSEGELRWRFRPRDDGGDIDLWSRIFSSPAICDEGRVYFGSYNNRFYSVDKENGEEVWNKTMLSDISSSPAIGGDGTIYVGSHDNFLYAINPNGTEKWSFRTHGEVRSSPAVGPEGMIYFGSYDNHVYSLYPNGTERWRIETDGRVFSSPALSSESTLYIGSFDGKLYAIGMTVEEKEDEIKIIPNDVLPIVIAILLLSFLFFGERLDKKYKG